MGGAGDPILHEFCPEIPRPATPATASMPPMPRGALGIGVEVVQVNLNGAGMNILGDAANEPSIAVDPTAPNRMAIGWRQFDSVDSAFRQAGYAWSNDGGRTWSPAGTIEPGVFRSDPVLRATPEGDFLYASLRGDLSVYFHRSTDGGRTWSPGTFAFGGDKQWFSLGESGEIFHHWTSSVNRSFDGGATWSSPQSYSAESGSSMEPTLGESTVAPDGAYYIVGRGLEGRLSVVRSDEPGGQDFTFQRGSQIPIGGNFQVGVPMNPSGAVGVPSIAMNPTDGPFGGEVYALCTVVPDGLPGDWGDLRFNRSIDRGASWLETPVAIDDDGGSATQWFGTMSIAPNGRIDVAWLDTRTDPVNDFVYLSALYFSSSEDGGRSWADGVQISELFDSRLGWPRQNKMGDYFHMVNDTLGADLAWCATFEGEQNVYYTRIGPRDCDGNGVADRDDIAAGLIADCDADGIPDACEIEAGDAPGCVGCTADFATPFGVLDLDDIVAFVSAYLASEPRADLASPSGMFDLADLAAFVALFTDGCP